MNVEVTPEGPLAAFEDLVTDLDRQARPPKRRRRYVSKGWHRLISPVLFVVVWQVASSTGLVSSEKAPSPTTVWSTAVHLTHYTRAYGSLQGALAASVERWAEGFAIGGALAVLLALIAGLSLIGENAVDPLMQMLRTVPLFGLVPVFIIWFGIGQKPKLVLIALGAAIPLYLNTFSGIRSVDGRLGELGKVFGLNKLQVIWHVVLPGALPETLVGLRQSLGTAWLSLVVAEQLNTKAGLGFMINQASQFSQLNVVVVALLVYTVLGLVTDWLVRLLERRTLQWRRELLA